MRIEQDETVNVLLVVGSFVGKRDGLGVGRREGSLVGCGNVDKKLVRGAMTTENRLFVHI